MTEILLLGTFHFMESPIDVLSAESQHHLEVLAHQLLQFAPDAIALEAAVHAQDDLDRSYMRFQLADLKNSDHMRKNTLGNIHIYGDYYPITYTNEAVQIGYRLARMANLPIVHAIDDDTVLDMSVLQQPSASLRVAQCALEQDMAMHQTDTLPQLLQYHNSQHYSELHHAVYIQANAKAEGIEMTADWYRRNLKIFHNLQRLAATHSKIFVLFGSGHLHILKDLIAADRNLKLIDSKLFL